MKYVLRNLFLLILIGYTLTVLPLNPELVALDLSRYSYENALRNQEKQGSSVYAYVLLTSQSPLVNPTLVEFLIRSEGGKKPGWTEPPALTLSVEQNGKTLKTLPQEAFAKFLMPSEGLNPWEMKYRLDLSDKALGLSQGSYLLKLSSTDKALQTLSPLNIPIQYLDDFKYVAAKTAPDAGKQIVVSYFPDKTGKYAIPVSREIPKSSKLFRTAVNQLLTPPPAELGLSPNVTVPRISTIRYTNGLVACVLGEPIPAELAADPELAAMARTALTESIRAIESPYQIRKIQYTWSGGPGVPGWPAGEVELTPSPQAWLGYDTGQGRILLTPAPVADQTAEGLFKVLQNGTAGLHPTIPGQVTLRGAHMEGDLLVLEFDTDLTSVLADAPEHASLMADSIANSFTTLPGVRAVQLKAGGSPVTRIGSLELPAPLERRPYVNP